MLQGQNSNSEKLRDSVESLRPFPDSKAALPLYTKINEYSKEDGNRNLYLYSKLFISYYQGDLGNSIDAYESMVEALDYAQDTSGIKPENIILAYQLMQNFERKRGNLIKAIDLNKKYIELELKNGANDVQMGISYLEIAIGFRTLGDLENALLYSTKSFELFESASDSLFKRGVDKNLRLFKSLQIRGLVYKDMKNYLNAIKDYTQSIAFLKKSDHYKSPQGVRSRIDAYNRFADAYLLNADLRKASETIQKLAFIGRNESYERYRYYELLTVHSMKKEGLSFSPKNIEKAIELASIQLENDKEFPSIARLYMIYGDYYNSKDSLLLAVEKYHDGLQHIDSNLDDNFSNNPDISQVSEGLQTLQLLEKKAEAFIQYYKKQKDNKYLFDGISCFNSAISLIDKMKSSFINQGSKYQIAEMAASIFKKALEANFILYQEHQSPAALNSIFSIMEKNKAEILFQNIKSKYNLLASSLPKSLIQEEINLKYDISYYSKQLADASQKSKTDQIIKFKDKLFKLNEALTFHNQKIKNEFPDYYNFKDEFANQVTLQKMQKALKYNQLIIEFFQTNDALYTISIERESAKVTKESIRKIEPILSEYFKLISNRPSSQTIDREKLKSASHSIYNHLINNIKNYSHKFDKLIIIPDGILNKIPFEPLMDKSGNMLIENHGIAYNYSARQFLENNNSPSLSNPNILCLAPTFEGYTTEERSCNSVILGELVNVQKEFEYLKNNFEGSFFNEQEANTTNLKDNFADFQIIHLATHACLDNNNPMLSQIYFSGGAMTSYDIQNLNSRPELVVLSACNTASGQMQDGEGIIGLSRGFFEAGVKGLQSSLWSIDDLSSSKIMQHMYYHLKRGESKSDALRLSKLDYLKKSDKLRSHPYYWAALIHIGNDNPIDFSTGNSWLIYSLTFFVLLALGLYFFKRKQK